MITERHWVYRKLIHRPYQRGPARPRHHHCRLRISCNLLTGNTADRHAYGLFVGPQRMMNWKKEITLTMCCLPNAPSEAHTFAHKSTLHAVQGHHISWLLSLHYGQLLKTWPSPELNHGLDSLCWCRK